VRDREKASRFERSLAVFLAAIVLVGAAPATPSLSPNACQDPASDAGSAPATMASCCCAPTTGACQPAQSPRRGGPSSCCEISRTTSTARSLPTAPVPTIDSLRDAGPSPVVKFASTGSSIDLTHTILFEQLAPPGFSGQSLQAVLSIFLI
jgi:hypothetical protein